MLEREGGKADEADLARKPGCDRTRARCVREADAARGADHEGYEQETWRLKAVVAQDLLMRVSSWKAMTVVRPVAARPW